MLSVSHLDTSACQIVGHFFQALCMQYTNPSPWMVGRTDERMKWQQYPSASMLAKGKSSGNICISNSMPFRTDKRVAGGHYCWGVLLWPPQLGLGGKCDKKWKFKMSKKSHHFLMLWPWPLTYDLEKLIRSGHYHYQCVYQIWEQSIPWFLSYRVNTIAGGGWRGRKTITSPDPSDTGDIIINSLRSSDTYIDGLGQDWSNSSVVIAWRLSEPILIINWTPSRKQSFQNLKWNIKISWQKMPLNKLFMIIWPFSLCSK